MIKNALAVVAIDDEPLALRRISLALSAIEDVELVGSCRSGKEGVELVKELKPDVLLLDINMAEFDGFDVMENLGDDPPLVIFITAFQEYAVRAFDVQALDYLLKPIEFDRLRHALDQARVRLSERTASVERDELKEVVSAIREKGAATTPSRYEKEIWAPWGGTFERLPVDQIDWIEAEGDYVLIHARGKTHLIRETMANMEGRLDPNLFTRVHRSAIVYHAKVQQIERPTYGRFLLALNNGEKVPVGRSYLKIVRRWVAKPDFDLDEEAE